MATKDAAITTTFLAWDVNAGQGKTGLSDFTIRGVSDGVVFTPAASPVEKDATNLKGVYSLTLTAGENDGDFMAVGGISATADIEITPKTWTNTDVAGIVDAVWDELLSGHTTALTMGANQNLIDDINTTTSGSATTVTVTSNVAGDGTITIHQGADEDLAWTVTGWTKQSLTGGTYVLRFYNRDDWTNSTTSAADLEVTATIVASGADWTVTATVADTDSTGLVPAPPKGSKNYRYQVSGTVSGEKVVVLDDWATVVKQIETTA